MLPSQRCDVSGQSSHLLAWAAVNTPGIPRSRCFFTNLHASSGLFRDQSGENQVFTAGALSCHIQSSPD